MKGKKKNKSTIKAKLHKRNAHQDRYDLDLLSNTVPELKKHIKKSIRDEDTIDFASAEAVHLLNKALLLKHYDLSYWDIPEGYLCPPIPGRADYIHNISDLLGGKNFGKIPKAQVLDIGAGANFIYPIIGSHAYNWCFTGSEIDEIAIENINGIIAQNKRLQKDIEIRKQIDNSQILNGVIHEKDRYDLVMCNPPFYSSAREADEANLRKTKNLHGLEDEQKRNFGGQNNELWCPGGERRFLSQMVKESKAFAKQCFWFTSLVSKSSHLEGLMKSLDFHKAEEIRTINMSQGNKASRILAWTFLLKEEQKDWRSRYWS